MSDNRAAFRNARDKKFIVREADDRFAEDNDIIIKNIAIGLNPVDEFTLYDRFPQIPGVDVAGEVIEVGLDVTRFMEGDRVIGHALAIGTNENRNGGFQKYTALFENMAARIPPYMSYQTAATLPLGVSTAAAALFQQDFLKLSPPNVPPAFLDSQEAVVIMGAAGNVGSNAVQLAKAAGYFVVATASLDKAKLVTNLGADVAVNDRAGRDAVVADVKKALAGKESVGVFDSTGAEPVLETAMAIAAALPGRKIAVTTGTFDDVNEKVPGVTTKDVRAVDIQKNEVGKMVYEFLQKALQKKQYQTMDTIVVGKQLEDIYDGVMKKDKATKDKKKIILLE